MHHYHNIYQHCPQKCDFGGKKCQLPYASAIWSLIYAVTCTKVDNGHMSVGSSCTRSLGKGLKVQFQCLKVMDKERFESLNISKENLVEENDFVFVGVNEVDLE